MNLEKDLGSASAGVDYQYAIDFLREGGEHIAQITVLPDWGPAFEGVYFEGVRRGELAALMCAPAGIVAPVWHTQVGPPYVSAFRVSAGAGGQHCVTRDIPTAYVRTYAERASADLVGKGVLQPGETFRYLVAAFAIEPSGAAAAPADLAVEEIPQPLPLQESSLQAFLRNSVPAGRLQVDGDMPVFIPAHVLEEAMQQARCSGDKETGGLLIGKLHRDSSIPEVFVEITAHIPAQHTQANSTKLTFTAATWGAARDALALRRRAEILAAWQHFHPDFCRLRKCPIEKRKLCAGSSAFFSAEDVHLHASMFGRAYNTALLISDNSSDGLTCSLFGWRGGMVAARGFHLMTADPPAETRLRADEASPLTPNP